MHVWRGVTRRDRRDMKTSAEFQWGARKDANEFLDDEALRLRLENEHVANFEGRIRGIMFNFLDTSQGKKEILLVSEQIEAIGREVAQVTDPDAIVVPPEMKKKNNIYEIFRKFDSDGSNSIDKDELRILLDELKVPMKDDELEILLNELDSDGGGEIEFDEFYEWFVKEAEGQRSKNRWDYLKSVVYGIAKGEGIYAGFKRMVLEVEARNIILDEAVHVATDAARKEFRIAHPPLYLCDRCSRAFESGKMLAVHSRDDVAHKEFVQNLKVVSSRFEAVERVFSGKEGRQLKAMRLLFSDELGTTSARIATVRHAPFRPFIADHGDGRSIDKLRKGDLVTGKDASSGIRPAPRRYGMLNQSDAPGADCMRHHP